MSATGTATSCTECLFDRQLAVDSPTASAGPNRAVHAGAWSNTAPQAARLAASAAAPESSAGWRASNSLVPSRSWLPTTRAGGGAPSGCADAR